MCVDLRARDTEAQWDGFAVLVLGLGGRLYIIGTVAEGIVELSFVLQHLYLTTTSGFGQLVCHHSILLIEPVLCGEVDDVLVVVAEVGNATLGVGLNQTEVELTCGELSAHHVDALADDLAGSAGQTLGLELRLGSEVEFDRLDGGTVVVVGSPPEVEVEVVAHVSLHLARTLNHILLVGVGAAHDSCRGQGIIDIKAAIGLIHSFINALETESAITLAIHVVEHHHAVAREAEAFGQGETHVGGDGRAAHEDVEISVAVESDVAGRVFQHTAGREVGLIRHMQCERKLIVAP